MANIMINTLTSNYILLNYDLNNKDNFIMTYYPKNDGVVNLTYHDFVNTFLSDNCGYIINNISVLEDNESEYLTIRINYKYLENGNGVHIFADAHNDIYIAKELYNNSYLKEIIEKRKNDLDLISSDINFKNAITKERIQDVNDRIWPEVIKIIDNFFDNEQVINFDNYRITQAEFRNYVNNNKTYIIKYILEYSEYLKMTFKSSAIFAGIGALGILAFTQGDNNDVFLGISAFMIATSLLTVAGELIYSYRKLNYLCKSKDKELKFRQREK